jgi:predicted RNase H-like HicB family nuclease
VAEVSYRVVVTREGAQWLADVPELEGAHTYANSLRKLDQYVREVIVLAGDLPDEAMPTLDLEYDYRLGDEQLDARVRDIRARRVEVEELRRRLEEETEGIIGMTRASNLVVLSQRDLAELIGLSHQRVSQLSRS